MFATTTLFGADLVLTWDDNSNNEDGFEVYRKQNQGEWLLIGATNSDDSQFVDHVVPVGTMLSYRVRAWNQFGQSDYTNIVSVNTFPPAAPSGLNGAVIKSEEVSFKESPTREVRIRTYRDSLGRIVISRS